MFIPAINCRDSFSLAGIEHPFNKSRTYLRKTHLSEKFVSYLEIALNFSTSFFVQDQPTLWNGGKKWWREIVICVTEFFKPTKDILRLFTVFIHSTLSLKISNVKKKLQRNVSCKLSNLVVFFFFFFDATLLSHSSPLLTVKSSDCQVV